MVEERWQQVRNVFAAAFEAPTAEQAAILAAVAGDEPELAAEAGALLEAHRRIGTFLDIETPAGDPLEGDQIGPYRLLRCLGRGGMGEVYLAVRADREFHQQVALKLLQPGLASAALVRRFKAERQILAALDHPNIARLVDGGKTELGLPYLVMEYVEGLPLDQYCERQGLDLRARLALFRQLLAAVQFAHQNLVVHRDLKPGNILVTDQGQLKLLDFGIAKLLNPERLGDGLAATATATRAMTPDYASPEQLRGEPITTASDVYTLGVLLCELLTGRHPLTAAGRRRDLDEADPEPPSVLARRWPLPGLSPREQRKWRQQLAGDLDCVVMTALAREKSRRYASAEQLSEDLRRYLEGLPIKARPAGLLYRTGKFLRRHRLAAAVALTLTASLAAFAGMQYRTSQRLAVERDRAETARASAERERLRAETVTALLVDAFKVADPQQASGATLTAREILDAGSAKLRRRLGRQPAVQADLDLLLGTIYQRLGLPDRAEPLLREALKLRRQLFGPRQAKVAEALTALAILEEERGLFAAAEGHHREALAASLAELGPLSPAVARSLHLLGMVLRRQGQLPAAENHLRLALERRLALLGPQHLEVAESLNGLGAIWWEQARWPEAEAAARQALEIRRRELGEEHPEVAVTLNLLAAIFVGQGRLEEAETTLGQALSIRRKIYPGDHPKVAESLNNLGALLKDRGRPLEAEKVLAEALAMRRRVLGKGHVLVATTLENLGHVAALRRDFRAAYRLQQEGLEIRRRALGERHPRVADSLVALAGAELGRGRPAQAEELLRRGLGLRRQLLPPGHPEIAYTLIRLAEVEVRRGACAQALTKVEEAIAALELSPQEVPRIAEARQVVAPCRTPAEPPRWETAARVVTLRSSG